MRTHIDVLPHIFFSLHFNSESFYYYKQSFMTNQVQHCVALYPEGSLSFHAGELMTTVKQMFQ